MRPAKSIWILVFGLAAIHRPFAQSSPTLTLQLADYVQMPITAQPNGQNTMAQLARVNFLRDEPGGRRFLVNDLNGPLYILDKRTKTFTTYLNFNGAGGRSGLFPRFTFERNLAIGLTNVNFDPDYARNGVFYTIHMEDPTVAADALPRTGVVPGLDLSKYTTTQAAETPAAGFPIPREAVLIEWTDRNTRDATFEGTARELLRLQLNTAIHPMGEITFNPVARRGDPDWRVMYIGSGDSGSGEQRDDRRLNPQRLDTLVGKILRIVPDLGEHTSSSTVSENGRYRIPNDNPFSSLDGARKEIWAVGLRNPHRLVWDVDPARPTVPHLFAFNIGLGSWETVMIVRKGANYGYPLREGTQMMTPEGIGPLPEDDTIPLRISDTMVRGTVKPTYPVIQYPHAKDRGGDAIAGGFIYRRGKIPALQNKLVFGDITTGRIWYAQIADVLAADDGNPATLAPMYEINAAPATLREPQGRPEQSRGGTGSAQNLRELAEATFHARGGVGTTLPGGASVSGPGRVDLRFAVDNTGNIYVMTKSDGMIRQVVGTRLTGPTTPTLVSGKPEPARGENRVASIAAGKKLYDLNCASCHGNVAQGAAKAGLAISIIEEQGGKQPPDLTDDTWDHGSTDSEIYTVIKKGIPPTMMTGYEGRIPDHDIWNIINYIRTLAQKK